MDRTHISVAQSAIEVPKASRGHILLIAQDVAVAKGVCADLDAAGLQCTFVRTCVHAQRVIKARRLDLILLDRMVLVSADAPCWNDLRGHRDASIVPILAFSRGDDALVVSARVRAFMQVATRPAPEKLEGHGIVLDRVAQRTLYRGHDLRLAAVQFRLLEYFLKNPGRILSRHELLASLWGYEGVVGRRVDVYVGTLRKLLGSRSGSKLIRTVRGAGYVFGGNQAKGLRLAGPVDGHEGPVKSGDPDDQLKLDYAARSLRIKSVNFPLSPREFAVLELLMLNPDMTFNRSVIANSIWGEGNVDPRTVDATISRLRRAIKQKSSSHHPIRSVIGRGYQFCP